MHIYSLNDLKFTLKHLKRCYMFRSYDHPQGAISCEFFVLYVYGRKIKFCSFLFKYLANL